MCQGRQGKATSDFLTLIAWLAAILLIPTAVYAQSSITGTVRETSGAVLPGVSVEVASPVLIEKVRTAATDSTGQYRIVSLPPGTYTIAAWQELSGSRPALIRFAA